MAKLQRITIAPTQLQHEQILLTSPQQHYLGRVLRLVEGDRFVAMDGKGKWWLAQLAGSDKALVLEPLPVETELPVSTTLMVALPKGNGLDEVVRCCTELGVECIVPVLSDRTLVHPSLQKLERWQRIAAEAAEQSERAIVPTILEPVAFSAAIKSTLGTHCYLCEGRGEYPHLQSSLERTARGIVIATGPEGGWTDTEIEIAIASGFKPVSLGRRILRAVTAPVAALTLVAASYEL